MSGVELWDLGYPRSVNRAIARSRGERLKHPATANGRICAWHASAQLSTRERAERNLEYRSELPSRYSPAACVYPRPRPDGPTTSRRGRGLPRSALIPDWRAFAWRRFTFDAAVGRVLRRTRGRTAAWRTRSTSRSSASARLRSCVRKRCAVITRTPSLVSRRPASFSRRARTSSGSDGEPRTSNRSCNRGREFVDVLAARTARADERLLDHRSHREEPGRDPRSR